MMFSSKTQNSLLWLLVIIMLLGVSWYFRNTTVELQKRIDTANETIAIMKLEHEASRIAATNAEFERREIYELAKEKLCRAETILGDNSVFCDMLIPDDLRMLWESPDNPATDHIQPAK